MECDREGGREGEGEEGSEVGDWGDEGRMGEESTGEGDAIDCDVG